MTEETDLKQTGHDSATDRHTDHTEGTRESLRQKS